MNRPGNEHGGDWAAFETEYGTEPLDFSMNVNPLGMSEKVRAAIAEASQKAERYPDPHCRQLRQALAKAEGVHEKQIFCGAGAADIIYRLAKAGRKGNDSTLLITAPTFSEYEQAFASEGWQIRRWLLKAARGFAVEEDFLNAIRSGVDLVFLCEPNNPTGVTTDKALLERILMTCQQTGTVLVIDECFNGFLDDPGKHSMKEYLREYDNLIILKAFTKLYGMAGVRLGYSLCAKGEMVEKLSQAGPPWNVSSLAQDAGIAALEDREQARAGRSIVQTERPWLKEELARIGCSAISGEANYILFKGPEGLTQQMRERGILIRNCDNYYGLGEGWYRIAVRTHEENVQLIAKMEQCIRK